MAQTKTFTRSWAGGEMSPEMFARLDDVRLQQGAAKMENFMARPQGAAVRRPGFEFVREVKNSAGTTRLMPFRFSRDQTLVLEMGRSTVDAREIGYFRFHTDGSTVLYDFPRDYVETQTVLSINAGSDNIQMTGHGFLTRDPVVITMTATTEVVTFTAGDPGFASFTNNFVEGQQIIFQEDVGGTLPPEVEVGTIYYVESRLNNVDFQISKTRFGPPMEFTANSSGTIFIGAMPWLQPGTGFLDVNVTYFAHRVDANNIKLMRNRDDTDDASKAMDIANPGTSTGGVPDLRVHYGYEIGELAFFTTGPSVVYPIREPWVRHQDTDPSDTNFWYRLPGDLSVVTFASDSETVNWTSHGLSEGDPVSFHTTGSLATPLQEGTTYFVRNPATNTFQLSATLTGAIIDLTDTGSGTNTALANAIFEVPHYYEFSELFEISYAQSNDVLSLAHPAKPLTELRRRGPTFWSIQDVKFNTTISPPDNPSVARTLGEGLDITGVSPSGQAGFAGQSEFTTISDHGFSVGDLVYVRNVNGLDEINVVDFAAQKRFIVKVLRTGQPITGATLGTSPTVHFVDTASAELTQEYQVTSLDVKGEESAPGNTVDIDNNLAIDGSFNTISWDSVGNADRYRIYKKQTGLFGLIGEVNVDEGTSFKDDNIAPDLSVTPPILDSSLYRTALITPSDFDTSTDRVTWEDHGLEDGDPVQFVPNDTLPGGLEIRVTYYVLNASTDTFQVSASADLSTGAIDLTGTPLGDTTAIGGRFPAAVSYFEQRRILGGTFTRPQDVWMTASGTESDLSSSIPTVDSDRIQFRVASREQGFINHIVPMGHLLLMTSAVEYRVTPLNTDFITPESISARPQSFNGSSTVQPIVVNNTALFVAARGGHLREIGFSAELQGFVSGDVSLRAGHLFDKLDIVQLAHGKAPDSVVWAVSNGGNLLALSYVPEEAIGAWTRHTTDGSFKSCAVVPEGDFDRLYVIVEREINENTVQYIERMGTQEGAPINDAFFVDSGLTYDGAAGTIFTGLEHLEGETVAILADGLVVDQQAVSNGQITLTTAASKVHVGLPYTSELETLPVSLGIEAFGRGRVKNINEVWLRVFESGPFLAGPESTRTRKSRKPAAGSLSSEPVRVLVPASWNEDGQVFIRATDPLPLTVVGMALEVSIGGG